MEPPPRETHGRPKGRLFTSQRERHLWAWTLVVVATILSTLGLAGTLAGWLGESGLNAVTFVLGSLLVLLAAIGLGWGGRPGRDEVFVAVGVAAVYILMFTRLTSAVERSHLIEYGVVALLIYAALGEREDIRTRWRVSLSIVAAGVIGLVDETIQFFLPNRVFDPVDVIFNTLAAAMAVSAASVLAVFRRRRSMDRPRA